MCDRSGIPLSCRRTGSPSPVLSVCLASKRDTLSWGIPFLSLICAPWGPAVEMMARFTVARTCLAWSPAVLQPLQCLISRAYLKSVHGCEIILLPFLICVHSQPLCARRPPPPSLPAVDISRMTCTLHPEDPLRLHSRDSSHFYNSGSVIDQHWQVIGHRRIYSEISNRSDLWIYLGQRQRQRLELSNTAICWRAAKERCIYLYMYTCICIH